MQKILLYGYYCTDIIVRICAEDIIVGGKAPLHNKVDSHSQEVSEPGMAMDHMEQNKHVVKKKHGRGRYKKIFCKLKT